jgi:hypothetical protein
MITSRSQEAQGLRNPGETRRRIQDVERGLVNSTMGHIPAGRLAMTGNLGFLRSETNYLGQLGEIDP